MEKITFTDSFNHSLESTSLIRGDDHQRIREILKLKEIELDEGRNKNQKNIHGYEFELEIWRFFLSLKPDYISNINTQFKFDLQDYRKLNIDDDARAHQGSKQTDIVAIFKKHIFVIECKATKNNRSAERLGADIQLFKSLNGHKTKRINKLFGSEYIPVYFFCTKGFNLDSDTQIQNLKKNNIILFSEEYKSYIDAVLESSGSAEFAFLQLLGFFRAGKPDYNEIKYDKGGQSSKNPWTIRSFSSHSGQGKKNNVYTFSISPSDMLKISTVSHQKAKVIFEAQAVSAKHYQRLLQKIRLKKIGSYISDTKTPFPNNILVSYRGEKPLTFKPDRKKNGNAGNVPGKLTFDACPGTFHVIDGQHRLFGYTEVPDRPKGLRESHRLIVTAFEGLDIEEEAQIFLEVNQEAKPVHASLIMEIEYASEKLSLENLCNGVVFLLRDKETSILFHKIQPAEITRGPGMKPKGMQTALLPMRMVRGEDSFLESIFWTSQGRSWASMQVAVTNIYNHLNSLLSILEKYNPDKWQKRDGMLQDIFIQGIFVIIDRITIELYKKLPIDDDGSSSIKKLTGKSKSIFVKLAEGIAAESDDEKDKIFSMKFYGQGAQAKQYVAAFLIDKYLKKKMPAIAYPGDEALLRHLKHGNLSAKQAEKMYEHINKLEAALEEFNSHKSKQTREKLSREDRAADYHGQLKDVVNLVLSMSDHFGKNFWDSLIMPGFWKEDNVWNQVNMRHLKEKNKAGNRAYKDPFNHVEGELLRIILSTPQKIRLAKADEDTNELRIERTLDFIWKNLLLVTDGEIPKQRGEDNSPYWKSGTEYIKIFNDFRNYSSKTHKKLQGEEGNPMEGSYKLFDQYEELFLETISNISEEIGLQHVEIGGDEIS
jgi:DGQHR domain-containing protein